MLWWLMNEWPDRHNWEIVVVFANTGKEHPETLLFVHRCAIKWGIEIVWVEAVHVQSSKGGWWGVRHKVVDYFSASRGQALVNGGFEETPFEQMISKLGIPSSIAPFCSDQLKRKPIESYLKSIGWKNYYKAIGIRIDEIDRASENWKKKKIFYPLCGVNPTKKTVIVTWWGGQEFDLEVPEDLGNCDGCWKKDMVRLARIGKKHPEVFDWWQHMTDTYGHLKPRDGMRDMKPPFNFYRGNLSPKDILKLSDMQLEQLQLFAEDNRLNSCSESCEAF